MGRWREPFENLLLALKPAFVQQVAYEVTHPDRLEVTSQRGIRDPQLLHLGLALRAELTTGCPGGQLYGESLATALAVHLLQHYTACLPAAAQLSWRDAEGPPAACAGVFLRTSGPRPDALGSRPGGADEPLLLQSVVQAEHQAEPASVTSSSSGLSGPSGY